MVVANGKDVAPQATDKCVALCRARLADILRGPEMVLLDDKKRIIQEYRNNLNEKGRGFGDRFWLELKRRYYNPEKYPNTVTTVKITPFVGNGNEFKEFPNDDPALENFHKKDRKFIAVALAYKAQIRHTATILLAIDSGWVNYIAALAGHGVPVDTICEEDSS